MFYRFSISKIFLVLLFFSLDLSVKAVVIKLNDGSKIKGKILLSEQDALTIENPLLGVIKIPKNTIVTITDQDQVLDPSKKESLSSAESPVNSHHKKGQDPPIESASISENPAIQLQQNPASKLLTLLKMIPEDWESEFSFELKGQSGNSDKEAYATEIASKRKKEDELLQFKLYYAKEQTNGIDSKDQSKYSVQYNNYFYEKFGWFIRQEFELDQIIQLDYQSVSSLGLAYRFIDNQKQQLRARIGLGFNRKVYQDQDKEEQVVGDLGITHQYQYRQWIKLTSELKWVPSFKTSDDFAVNHDSGLIIPTANKSWKIRLGIKNKYTNLVNNATIKKLDSQYYSKLIFSF